MQIYDLIIYNSAHERERRTIEQRILSFNPNQVRILLLTAVVNIDIIIITTTTTTTTTIIAVVVLSEELTTSVQILCALNLLGITSKFSTVSMCVTDKL